MSYYSLCVYYVCFLQLLTLLWKYPMLWYSIVNFVTCWLNDVNIHDMREIAISHVHTKTEDINRERRTCSDPQGRSGNTQPHTCLNEMQSSHVSPASPQCLSSITTSVVFYGTLRHNSCHSYPLKFRTYLLHWLEEQLFLLHQMFPYVLAVCLPQARHPTSCC